MFWNLTKLFQKKSNLIDKPKEFELVNEQSDIIKIQMYVKKNFLSIQQFSSDPDYKLGFYYQFKKKNYLMMKKFYLKSINKSTPNPYAMSNLGYYYQYVEKNYTMMKKYYLDAIEFGDTNAMFNLAHYYANTEFEPNLYNKYLEMFYIIKKIKDI